MRFFMVFICIIIFAFTPLIAQYDEYDEYVEYCPIELSTDIGVVCGFSSEYVDSLMPVSSNVGMDGSVIEFLPSYSTNSFNTGTFFFYAQIITSEKVSIGISSSPGFEIDGITVNYTNSGFDTSGKFTGSGSTPLLYSETETSSYPRVFCCQFNLSIPFSSIPQTSGTDTKETSLVIQVTYGG